MGWYMLLFQASLKMRDSKTGKKVYDLLESAGIRIAVSRFANWRTACRNERHPNEQMRNSTIFYKQNAGRVRNVIRLLADEESKDVFKQMIRFRCFSRYKQLPHYTVRTQYFGNDFFTYGEEEVFVDCGAYDGDSVQAFKKMMKKKRLGGGYRIVAFEPDKKSFHNLMRNHPDITGIQAGVWKEDGYLAFSSQGCATSVFEAAKADAGVPAEEPAASKVPVRSIDHTYECQDATFIKMDVEGSEYYAIEGAKTVICKNKPKLAICIYHSDEDMLRLIEKIHEMVPGYRFYIRQHSNTIYETVLYAVYEKNGS